MELEALSEQVETTYDLADKQTTLWNGRFIQKEDNSLLSNHSYSVIQTMSRPPDRANAQVKGGYDAQRGPYFEVEGGVSWDLQSPSTNKESNRSEPNRCERDSDRHHDQDCKTEARSATGKQGSI
jgi:hypothetical protein